MSQRCEFRGKFAMRKADGSGSLLAYFNVVDNVTGVSTAT